MTSGTRWTIIGKSEKRGYVKCRCECGTVRDVRLRSMVSGESKSCGCYQRERTKLPKNRADLKGRRFGMLRVEELAYVKDNETYWRCACDCGGEKVVRGSQLTREITKSCGCMEKANREIVSTRAAKQLHAGTNVSIIRSDKLRSNNTSGIRGISWLPRKRLWVAKITFAGERYQKTSKDLDVVVAWREEMEKKLFAPVIEQFDKMKGERCNEDV